MTMRGQSADTPSMVSNMLKEAVLAAFCSGAVLVLNIHVVSQLIQNKDVRMLPECCCQDDPARHPQSR